MIFSINRLFFVENELLTFLVVKSAGESVSVENVCILSGHAQISAKIQKLIACRFCGLMYGVVGREIPKICCW